MTATAPSLDLHVQPIKKILFNQEQLEQIKAHLLRCIDSLTQMPSLFTQVSLFWQQLTWWQKVGIGLVSVVPLIIGLATQLALLTAVGLSLLSFTGLSIVLAENHSKTQTLQTQELKTTILTLADLLGSIIQSLEASSNQLAKELNTVHEANQTLTKQCQEFKEELSRLSRINQQLEQHQQELFTLQNQLQTTITTLDVKLVEQTALLEKSQLLLTETTEEYKKNQMQLALTVTELSEVKGAMAKAAQKAQKVTTTLKATVTALSSQAIANAEQRELFIKKLEEFFKNQEQHLDAFINNISQSSQLLSQTTQEIQDNNSRINELLAEQEEQVQRLTKVDKQPVNVTALLQHGFLAKTRDDTESTTPVVAVALAG